MYSRRNRGARQPPTLQALTEVYEFARNNPHSGFYSDLPPLAGEGYENIRHRIPLFNASRFSQSAHSLSHYAESETDYLSSSFNPEETAEVFLVPRHINHPWELLEGEMRVANPTVAALIVPPFWQLGPIFYRSCRRERVTASVLLPRNIPLAVQIIREAEVGFIVTTPRTARELAAALEKEGLLRQIKTWYLVTPLARSIPEIPLLSGRVLVEQNLFPGIPIRFAAFENAAPSLSGHQMQPLDREFLLEDDRGRLLISSLIPHALPLIRFDTGLPYES